MSIKNLNRVLSPKSIAVIGASNTIGKVGFTVFKNILEGGFKGAVYPVNTNSDQVQGQTAYASVLNVPAPLDLAVIATPAETVPSIVRECGERGMGGAVILTAGFRELGPKGMAIEQRIRDEQARFPGFRIIGPNCVGIINPQLRLSASFAVGMPEVGRIAFLSQSGALCTAVLDWALSKRMGFSHFVSLGNQLDVGFADLLDFLAEDPQTTSAALYIESISNSRYFMSAARAFARKKPLIAYKAGRFKQSAQAAASHTGAMAGVDEVYQAAFDRAGIVRVFDMQSLFESAELLSQHAEKVGPRLAVVTNAGGPGVMAVDTLLELRGSLAELSQHTVDRLNQFLPHNWSRGNPVDVIGDADAERFVRAVDATLQDEGVDTVLCLLAPQAMTNPTETARQLIQISRPTGKVVLASWMGGLLMTEGRKLLQAAGIPSFDTPEQAVNGLMTLQKFTRNQQMLYETPKEIPLPFSNTISERQQILSNHELGVQRSILTEVESKQLLREYGIATTEILTADTANAAVEAAQKLGFPVVMKIYSPQITHKTDVDGVALNLRDESQVCQRFTAMTERAKSLRPDAKVLGVTIQPMITTVHGVELILGAKRDPVFGTVIMAGLGGITAELFKDLALELPPVSERLIMGMLTSLKCWPLLTGYRGRARIDTDRLVELVLRFSTMIVEQPNIVEIDINPVLIGQDLLIALDARVVIAAQSEQILRPFDHLAIRPYPIEFEKTITLGDGTDIRLRPIRPEDELRWRAMLERCSEETIVARFHALFKEFTHEMAVRFCFIDYDRELAMVAEVLTGESTQLVGVGRLVADANRKEAEFALLIEDNWQNRGLGTTLTKHCLDIAKLWGIQKIVAESEQNDGRMIAIFNKLGFQLDNQTDEQIVLAKLSIK